MGSLTTCFRKIGEAPSAADKDAIIARARELRAGGMAIDAAALQAARELLEDVRVDLKSMAEPKAPKASVHPKTVMGSELLALVSQRMGGLDPAWLSEFSTRTETGRKDKAGKPIIQWRNPPIPGVGLLFRRGGTQDLQAIAEMLEQDGYLEPGAVERDYKAAGEAAKDMIRAALNRKVVERQDTLIDAAQARMDAEREAYYAELDAESAREAEAERAAIMAKSGTARMELQELDDDDLDIDFAPLERQNTPEEVAAGMRSMGFTEQEIADELASRQDARATAQAGPAEAGQDGPQDAPAAAGAGEDAQGNRAEAGAEQGLTLSAQTPQDLQAKADREAIAAKADAAEQKRLADKAKADAQRDEFTLTGSDRPADVAAAAGQGGLFDTSTQPVEKATANRPDPKQGDRFTDRDGKPWQVWSFRHGVVEAHPVVGGKPQVNADTREYWAIDRGAMERFPERRTDFNPVDAAAPKSAFADNKVFTQSDMDKAREILRKKLRQFNSGIDPEMMQAGITLAGGHIEAGARTFAKFVRAMVEDLGEAVRPYLKSWYAAVSFDPRAQAFAPDMTPVAELATIDIDAIGKEPSDVPSPDAGVERDRADAADQARTMGDTVPAGAGATAPGAAARGSRSGSAGRRPANDPGVLAGGTLPAGERGDQRVPGADRAGLPEEFPAGPGGPERSGDGGERGIPPQHLAAGAVEAAAGAGLSHDQRAAAQRAADAIPVVPGDAENIAATLPYLLSGQQEDVGKAEARFAQPDGYGILFTNGTGTGKTFTGLGVIKRFARQGKTDTLIVVPDEKIMADWVDSAKALGLDVTPLKSTKDAGSGIVVTTYANLGDNAAVAGRNWDLVVADEAQLLSSNKDGDPTKALTALRAITHHPRGAYARYEMLHAADIQRLSDLTERINSNVKIMNSPDTMDEVLVSLRDENQKLEARQSALSRTLDAARKAVEADVKARQGAPRARVLMLSATPFAYEKSVDLAEGYLFDYKDGYPYDETSNRYNQPNPREYFFMTHFGYRMRVNKLTEPDDPKLDRGLLQRQFNGWLKKSGVLSQRTLDVPADYDRRFVLVESAVGRRIDDALNWVSEKSRQESEANRGAGKGTESTGWASLNSVLTHELYGPEGFRVRRYLLEAIKAKEVIPHIREHMAMGRKVVVFHDFNKGGSRNPFALEGVPQSVVDAALGTEGSEGDAARKAQQYNEALAEFKAEFPDLTGGDLLADLISPIQRFKRDLPGVLLVNGLEKKPDILARYKTFNDDAAGPQVMLVQSSKDAGWSGHDTTGKHQRVLFNLGLPTKPTTAIQQEGRIYRTGQVSDAMQRYLNTGTTWERWAFAQTIAQRAGVAENLAAGESARALRDAFISAFEESDDYRAGHEGEGKGGKARDRFIDTVTTEWDRAKSFYRGTQKKNSRTKAEEGEDYFATPEPVGLKMVQWADLRGGESALEPSGGHGAIARWIPETVKATAIEPSMALRSRMALVFQGDIKPGTFEDHHIVNKYDGVTMNPPFGTAGRTAIDHVAKAAQHLNDGGRIVALIPTGPAADAKFEKWLYAQDAKGKAEHPDLHLVADIRLPAVTFERAGTRVMTRIVVIEKGKNAPQMVSRDLTDITGIEELFDRLEDMQIPPRVMAEAPAAAPASSPAGRTDARAQAQAEKEKAQESGADMAARLGLQVVEHTTGKGKLLRGVVRTDLKPAQAQEVDAYTFRKDGGQFIRLEHLAEMLRKFPPPGTVAAEERAVYAVNEPAGTDAPLDLFPESLEGLQALPAQPRAGAPGKRRPAAAWDAQPAAGVPAPNTFAEREDPQFPGLYHYSTQLVAVGQRELPVASVKTWQDAASALASLRRYAVEHFDVLVTDKDGKPLAVVGSFKGAQAQTSVYPSTLLAEALRIKDAAKAWGVHNHPSGNEKLSRADEMLSNAIGNAFSPSSVEWMGISAVGGDRFSAYDGVRFTDGKVIDGAAKATVPVVERTITPGNVGMPVLDSPQKAKDVAATVGAGRSGVLFTDQQRRVTAFVPLESAHAAELRKDGRFDRLINSASNAGAAAGIIVNQAGVYDARTLENIASALRLADIRVLDAIDPARGTSAAEKGVEPRGNMPVLSRVPQTETEAFKRWFGDSKVVDASGKPLVVYHGTTDDISVFKRDLTTDGGFHFGDSAQASMRVAGQGGRNIMPVYLSIENPRRSKDAGGKWASKIKAAKSDGHDGIVYLNRYEGIPQTAFQRAVEQIAKERGGNPDYVRLDALSDEQFRRYIPEAKDSYIAFRPEQIKSAIGNRGTFDPDSADIRLKRGTGPGSDIATLKPHIDGITAKLQGLRAPVEVVRTVFDLPQDIVAALRSMNAMGTTRGLRMPDGRVFLVADKLKDQAEAEFVLFHELFGHEGIRALLDEEAYARELTRLKLANPALAAEANRWFAAYGADQIAARVERGMSVPEARKVVRLLAIEEALSDRAGLNEPLKGWRALMAVVQKALRAIGAEDLANWLEGKTQAETMALLAGARRAITEGVAHVTRQDATAAASREAPIWYSALLAEVSKSPMKAGNAAAWGQYVDALTKRGAIKADELEWTGLKDWLPLQEGKITKDQISEYLSGNAVRVTETVLGRSDDAAADLNRALEGTGYTAEGDNIDEEVALYDPDGEYAPYFDLPDNIKAIVDAQAGKVSGPAKYSQYTLPGGTNYREVLLTLPTDLDKTPAQLTKEMFPGHHGGFYDLTTERQKQVVARQNKTAYRSSHWEQPNVLAHIRVNDRVDADGKRVLFVEEIQSDWGQEGKKKGFASGSLKAAEDAYMAEIDRLAGKYGVRKDAPNKASAIRMAADREDLKRLIELNDKIVAEKAAAPLAPFVGKTDAWVSLALKRIIHMAATEGYDRVAFVNGEQSAERYDLSKHIDSMDVRKIDNGKLMIYANKNNEQVLTKMTEPDGLADVIGKDMANRVLADIDAGRPTQYRGLDLRTGGEGMKAFYDRIIPLAARDVLRRLGVSEHALGGKAVAPKMDRNGGLIDAKAIRDLALSQAFKDKGFKGLAPDVKRLVQSHMLALAKDRQVLQSVVSSVPVDVVNVLRAKQLSPEMFFHDPSMLVDDLAAKLGADVAAQIDVASALVSAAASVAAEAPAMGPIRGRGVSLERGATVGTGLHKDILAQIEIPGIGAQPGFSVTPAMREKAAGGMPLFSRRDAAPAVAPAVAVTRDENGTPTEFVGPRVVLAFPQETERFEVIPEPGQQILSYAIMPTEGFDSLGFVELLMENGRPVSLLDIEVNAYGRQLGTGSAVIETLLAADPSAELHISNIVESARGFWSRMGVPEQNRAPGEAYDGILNWQTFAQAQDARGTRGVGRRTAAGLAAEPDRGGQGPDRGGAGNPQGDGRGASDLPALSRSPNTTTAQTASGRITATVHPISYLFSRDPTGRLQFAPGAWLYGAMGRLAGPLLSKLALRPISPELKAQLRQMKLDVQRAQDVAVDVAKEGQQLSEAERAMVSDIIEKELKAGTVPAAHAVRMAAVMNQAMGAQSRELVDLGMLTQETVDRWGGAYLPRFYESKLRKTAESAWADAMSRLFKRTSAMQGIKGKHLKARGLWETIPVHELPQWLQLGWEVRDPNYRPGIDSEVQVWRDYTRQEREDMGEIRDSVFRFVMGYMQTQRDIALGRMFKSMAEDPASSSRLPRDGWVKVPDTTIPDTGARRYGMLAGRWVPADTLSHLSQIEEVGNEALQLYRRAMAVWKMGKTALNPVSHVNNIVSNLSMAHFAGVSYWRGDKYAAAIRDFATGAESVKKARDAGLFLGTMTDAELMQDMPEALRDLVAKAESRGTKGAKFVFDVMTFGLRKPMGKAYQFEDTFFRYLLWKDATDRGMEPGAAVDWATKFIFNYDDLPKGARRVRDFAIPFVSYTYKAIPALLETALTHPLRMAAPAALMWAANAAMYAMATGDDDDDWYERMRKYLTDDEYRERAKAQEKLEREHLPPWMKGTTALLTPKTIRLGMDEVTKLPLFMDVSRLIPGGDLFDVSPNAGGLPIPQPLTPSHPLLTTATAMLGNRDLWTGKDLVDRNDDRAEAAGKRAEWIWRQAAPAMAIGNYHFDRVLQAVSNAAGGPVSWLPEVVAERYTGVGRDNLPVQPHLAAMQTFGIKVRPIDIELSMKLDEADRRKLIQTIDAEMRSLRRRNRDGSVADTYLQKQEEKAAAKKERLREGLTVDGDQR